MRAMSATPGELPAGPGWAYEMGWDGPRVLVEVTGGEVRVLDAAAAVTEWTGTGSAPALGWAHGVGDALVDGHLIRLAGPDAPVFVAGDLLRLYGVDLRDRTYAERRDTLERLAAARPALTVSPRFDDAAATDAAARQHGLPGVVAKRLDSRYVSGRRSPDWIERRFDVDRSRT